MTRPKAKIEAIEYYIPEQVLTNERLQQENPLWDLKALAARTGVQQRGIAAPDETALDLAFKACKQFFGQNKDMASHIDGLIFCTQSEDYILPPNCCLLHKLLELPEEVLAFDFNLACSGYVYGLAIAEGLISTGRAKHILLVNADTYSKYIHPQDRSTRVLFGDGAAVSLITAADSEVGIIDMQCCTSGKNYDKFILLAGGNRVPKSSETGKSEVDRSGNIRTQEHIRMDGMGILTFVNNKVPQQINTVLERNHLTLENVDVFIFHQASSVALDSLQRMLHIKPEKVFRNLKNIGNTVSASIPIALKDAQLEKMINPGDKVLLSGFGVGLSWGTALIQF